MGRGGSEGPGGIQMETARKLSDTRASSWRMSQSWRLGLISSRIETARRHPEEYVDRKGERQESPNLRG